MLLGGFVGFLCNCALALRSVTQIRRPATAEQLNTTDAAFSREKEAYDMKEILANPPFPYL